MKWTLAALVVCTLASPSDAVTNIRFERWHTLTSNLGHDTTAPVDTTAAVGVSFDATVTATDLAQGFSFGIAEKQGAGHVVLAHIALTSCVNSPPVGSDVYISVSFRLYCDGNGKLHARPNVLWSATWCNLPVQSFCLETGNFAIPISSSDDAAFELVLVDENDQQGSFATPENGLTCGDGQPHGPELSVTAPEFADSGSIGVYADPSGVLCADHIVPLVPFRWYVVARLNGMTRCGLTLVELGIHPQPENVFFSITPNPAAHEIGNPFTTGGVGFESCERGDGEVVVLYTLDGIATAEMNDVVLRVEAGAPPTNQYWPYPWAELCPRPLSFRRRMVGTDFVINPSPGHPCDTTIGAENATWGAVKGLYNPQP